MSFLSKIAASVGMGSCHIAVAAMEPQQLRGSISNGTLLLQGGDAEQDVKMVTVDLTEFWVTGSGKNRTHHQRVHQRVTVAENVKVGPGFHQEYAFQFALPSDARCTRRREGWTLNAEAHIPWAVDARAHAVLKVLPHAEILALQRAAKGALGLVPIDWDGSREQVYYNFGAPPELQHQLDGVAFRVQVVGDTVTGEMILNKQEQGVGGFLQAMVGGDKETLPLSIPRSVLLTKRGGPNPAGALPYLSELFRQIGIVPPAGVDAASQ
jgi:sporulation-control protein spo0M